MSDSILCHDVKDAHTMVDVIGGEHIDDFEYLEDGKIRIVLNCRLEDIEWTDK